jgi:proteasome lid subunit RPN8/RPN11
MEQETDLAVGKWNAPECPFRIEYSARVLDDIRLAVVDAFFSLPRGGAEIGGILLGKLDGDRISITDYEALDCEHALGPSFTLSPRDQLRLAEITDAARRSAPNRQPVGWYHSHTRSDIFLSDTDQDIHKRFFPDPWQVALVLKPHTFEPMRGGFFFRETDGSMRGAASYQEFQIDPLPPRPALSGNGGAFGGNSAVARRPVQTDSAARATLLEIKASAAPPLPAADPPAASAAKRKAGVPITREVTLDPPLADHAREDGSAAAELDAPSFGQRTQEGSGRALKAAAILAVGLAAGGIGYQTRQFWLPRMVAKARAVLPKEPGLYLSLAIADDNGQLKIQWDRNAAAVRNALEATLEIADGNTVPQSVRLDSAHLASGAFTYARQTERVDVTLIATEPSGQVVKEQTSFLGRLPAAKEATDAPPANTDRDAEAQRAEKLQKDLNFQAAKTRRLEKEVKDMREQLNGRTDGQTPDPTKKN